MPSKPFTMNKSNDAFFSLMKMLGLFGMGFATCPATASSFELQSTTLVMSEQEGRATFNVTNTGRAPILLLTKLEDLGGESMAKNVLVMPSVTRIDPGQSQITSFLLKKGVKLGHEYMLKASFEGVEQRAQSGTTMPVRQEIGFILQPKFVPVISEPWKELQVTSAGTELSLINPGKHVVRIGPLVTLQPSGTEVPLARAYILPGERVSVSSESASKSDQISITPLSRYGVVLPKAFLPVKR